MNVFPLCSFRRCALKWPSPLEGNMLQLQQFHHTDYHSYHPAIIKYDHPPMKEVYFRRPSRASRFVCRCGQEFTGMLELAHHRHLRCQAPSPPYDDDKPFPERNVNANESDHTTLSTNSTYNDPVALSRAGPLLPHAPSNHKMGEPILVLNKCSDSPPRLPCASRDLCSQPSAMMIPAIANTKTRSGRGRTGHRHSRARKLPDFIERDQLRRVRRPCSEWNK